MTVSAIVIAMLVAAISGFIAIWERVDIARGMAIFDPKEDVSVSDVVRRADKLMYENKWLLKEKRAKNENYN